MSLLKTKRGKMFLLLGLMVLMIAVLSGCAPSSTVTHTTEDLKNGGFWQSNVVYYFAIALDTFAKWFNGQYGLAVLVMVIIVRTLILPLTMKQVKSSRAMQAIQPELQKIQKKYKDQPEKVQQETMRLFQENKVNPMAGCLPLIVQMPIFIALYNSIYYNPDLREHSFLWLQLGEPDKLFILPLLAAATTFLQTRMMTKMNPIQQQGPMQFMMMVYPVLIFIMSYNFPAALPLYWVYSNVYTIIQNYFLYRNNDKTKLAVAGAGTSKEVNLVKGKDSSARKDVTPAAKGNSGKAKGAKKSK
ncbi:MULTISPECIES: YidC/Oxa1 family membrane protein insertase [unclassified Paenibacillus]|uniref:YidC/Oxa1 family membrane protein insertase n=1 Tax=unclassified Paenibacillus TaxID=185978 RepID=UPI00240558DF|nr:MULTISPECIES: YidC/Oxa1 family membrane protein insertase [unclassified Paenibacillus]MDF9839697.1 YidC/Oxa1 family membrane protein insertase [Paenibacillus sp. PastF-2]MDF9846277.1 YidC/Oxa1 family membrane protein insertase [Paenibacillus sp. PastM-2]MDF9853373.1 YidC/Oxa1 family membrane protein insertase [Paenibacillus sp. PastF-1]MDH6478123.1 YidC/Oxa1 family membrane protein insertase [Paenibacillus sp. PastH-2]MDH6506378.1 YidC/Oxa1 family membrane protein insertase [Paenibacillus s